MLTVPEIKWLVTHSGGFHADEVMASVILTKVFPAAEIGAPARKAGLRLPPVG